MRNKLNNCTRKLQQYPRIIEPKGGVPPIREERANECPNSKDNLLKYRKAESVTSREFAFKFKILS